MGTYKIAYEFQGENTPPRSFAITIDETTVRLIEGVDADLPEWTLLGYQQCPHCPLKADEHPTCPVARAVAPIVAFSNAFKSFNKVKVSVRSEERVISAEASAQVAFGSLIGLLTATSGCPYTEFLKPMARFHLPFASLDETIYRVFSMYLLAQYFRNAAGETADFRLEGLKKMYENVEVVNLWMTRRLHEASQTDASLNAVIVLDTFAKTMLALIDDTIDEMKPLFKAYIK